MTVRWAVAGVAYPVGSLAADTLDGRARRIRDWIARAGDRVSPGMDSESAGQWARDGRAAKVLRRGDLGSATQWAMAVVRRHPRPGDEVLARIARKPVAGSGVGEVGPMTVPMEQVLQIVEEDAYAGSEPVGWGADVPWEGNTGYVDSGGMLALRIRGFLPDPALNGVRGNPELDWQSWLWVPPSWVIEPWDPGWLGHPPSRSRLFCASREFGAWGLPVRVDLDDVEADTPAQGATSWLVRRGDGAWWVTWLVESVETRRWQERSRAGRGLARARVHKTLGKGSPEDPTP